MLISVVAPTRFGESDARAELLELQGTHLAWNVNSSE